MCAITCNGTRQPRPPAIAGIAPTIPTAARAFSPRCRTMSSVTTAAGSSMSRPRRASSIGTDAAWESSRPTSTRTARPTCSWPTTSRPTTSSAIGAAFASSRREWPRGWRRNADGGYLAGMGVAYGDFDGDGRLDLAVTNFLGESTTLYHNHGGGLFSDRAAAAGLAAPTRFVLGFGLDRARCEQRRLPRPGAGQRPRRRPPPHQPLRDARAALSG